MAITRELLAVGWQHYQQHALAEADRTFRQVIELDPQCGAAHYMLGVIAFEAGQWVEAIAELGRAAALKSDFVEAHHRLGHAYQAQGRFAEAIACYRQVLRLTPDFAEARDNLAAILQRCDREPPVRSPHAAADEAFRLGAAFIEQGLIGEAIVCFEQAVAAHPQYADAHNNLGVLLHREGRTDEAIAAFRQGLCRNPDHASLHNNLGAALQAQDNWADAIDSYRAAVRCQPDFNMARHNLGKALLRLGRLDEAATALEEAMRWNRADSETQALLASVYRDRGQRDEARACVEDILRRDPSCPGAHVILASLLLQAGVYERGWAEYEWRSRCAELVLAPALRSSQPAWDGSPLEGRTILLRAEQGLGDTLQFIRYATLLKGRGSRVIVECQAPLVPLIGSCPGVDAVIARGEPLPAFDVHALLMSLPYLLRTTIADIPATVPYLAPEPARVEHWRRELSTFSGFKVGIVWQGNPRNAADRRRSVPLRHFARLIQVAGAHVFSLQVGPGCAELAEFADRCGLTDLGARFDPESFDDAAAVVKNLDLVISVCTSMAHLAGALAAPAWIALPFAADWRWLLDRADSPWYPTLRLFRQKTPDDWNAVFDNMAEELAGLVRGRQSTTAR